jgi:hypothetical protein
MKAVHQKNVSSTPIFHTANWGNSENGTGLAWCPGNSTGIVLIHLIALLLPHKARKTHEYSYPFGFHQNKRLSCPRLDVSYPLPTEHREFLSKKKKKSRTPRVNLTLEQHGPQPPLINSTKGAKGLRKLGDSMGDEWKDTDSGSGSNGEDDVFDEDRMVGNRSSGAENHSASPIRYVQI